MNRVVAATLAVCALAPGGSALANTVTHVTEFTVAPALTHPFATPSDQWAVLINADIPPFDPTLGTLRSVEYRTVIDYSLEYSWTSVDGVYMESAALFVQFPGDYSGLDILYLDGSSTWINDVYISSGKSFYSTDLSGKFAFSGRNEDVSVYHVNDFPNLFLETSSIRAHFRYWFVAGAEIFGERPIQNLDGVAKIKLQLSYNYLPGIPEPSTWALMFLGFGGAGTAIRTARARTVRGSARRASPKSAHPPMNLDD